MREPVARLQLATPHSFPEPSQWLTLEEFQIFKRIRAPRRRQDWLAGRLAAKELVQRYLLETTGLELALLQIEIINDEHGAPYVDLTPWPPSLKGRAGFACSLGERFCISLAHSAGHGLAGFSPHGSIGVDLQQIRPVRSDLVKRALSEHERKQLSHFFAERELEGLLVFWALKEAAIKAQRARPAPALREITVMLAEPRHAEICLRSQKLTAQWGRWKEFIWAWALADKLDNRHAIAALIGRGRIKALHDGQCC